MKLLDSNLIIYAAQEQYASLRLLVNSADTYVSIITKIEAFGFHRLTPSDKIYLEGVFNTVSVPAIDEVIVDKAIEIRQQKKMSVGDCIIAATALLNGFDLYTNNTADFIHIDGLTVINPLDSQ